MDYKRNPQEGATDWLLRMDDGTSRTFATEREARLAMIGATQVPVEEEMISTILPMLKQLKEFYATLMDMTADWRANDIPGKIDNALANGVPLAGYNPALFVAVGETFKALQTWIESPIALPPEILTMLGVKELTPELVFRIKWLSEAAKQ